MIRILIPARVAALALAVLALMLTGGETSPAHRAAGAQADVAGRTASVAPEVLRALQDAPTARVIVRLTEAPMTPDEARDRGALRVRMRNARAPVLASLPAAEFAVTREFDGAPAFAGRASAAAIQRLALNPRVRDIVLDGVVGASLATSVPMINGDAVQSMGLTGAGVNVAVLDTGIDTDHADLADDILYQECFLSGGGCPGGGTTASGPGAAEDDNGHGTHVSGIITSDGVVAAKGVAPDASVAAYKVLDASGNGYFSDFDAALSDILVNHPEISAINMSLGDHVNHGNACDDFEPTTTNLIDSLFAAGTITVVAAGNEGYVDGTAFPACVTSAVSVGAVWDGAFGPITAAGCTQTTAIDLVTCWSNSTPALDLLAPGGVIISDSTNGGTMPLFGTSMAAPHVVGVAALVKQAAPTWTPAQILAAMKSTGVSRADPKNGIVTPRLNAYAALVPTTDPDGDGLPAIMDNCPNTPNAGQQNYDGNLIDLPPSKSFDDKTRPNSDLLGDACDADADNDGLSNVDEMNLGPGGSSHALCPAATANTSTLNEDTDGDRYLDGAECALGSDPADAASRPTRAACGPPADSDGDGVLDGVETCAFNTSNSSGNTDGDACGDAREIASVNGDTNVNAIDLQQVAAAFGSSPGTGYITDFDPNRDGSINSIDLQFIAGRFGACP